MCGGYLLAYSKSCFYLSMWGYLFAYSKGFDATFALKNDYCDFDREKVIYK